METKKIGFIGGGRITNIMLHAFENSRIDFEKVVVYDPNNEVLNLLKLKFPNIISTENLLDVVRSEIVFMAIHPPVMMETLAKLKGELNNKTLLTSLAPKITMEKMASALGGFSNLARMIPSASTLVNKGINPVAFHTVVSAKTKTSFLEMMRPLGSTLEVAESKMEAYAVISAMGHTYFFFQLQKLKELAINFGMNELEAQTVITDMLWGTTETLFKSGLSYDEVTDLIPVKPMGEVEETIKGFYDQYLMGIFAKIKP
ncbi:MAG TPA: NAD(P)-binding domain-containing protein [Bacteroidales bacterium]|nr:NAD(P)-binding domain-containing protein [Bacteroidales bacterium]